MAGQNIPIERCQCCGHAVDQEEVEVLVAGGAPDDYCLDCLKVYAEVQLMYPEENSEKELSTMTWLLVKHRSFSELQQQKMENWLARVKDDDQDVLNLTKQTGNGSLTFEQLLDTVGVIQ